jgi:diketogulonate reductase-like aldo/keto reductase
MYHCLFLPDQLLTKYHLCCHRKENLAIFEFELKDQDMHTINELKHNAKGFMHLDVRNTD